MAKKKLVQLADTIADGSRDSLADFMGISAVEASSFNVFTGVQIPSLAFQWMMGSNVIPLGRVIELAGRSMARKSTFLFELMRWHLVKGGRSALLETEGKDSAAIRHAVWKYDRDAILKRCLVKSESTYDEWIQDLYKLLAYYGKNVPDFPVIAAVDSITAAGTDSMQEEIDKDWMTHAKYPTLAKELSHSFKTIPARLKNLPILFVFTNHYKDSMDAGFAKQGTRPGGSALQFAESCSILFTMSGKRAPDRVGMTANWLNLKTIKPMMAPTRSIDILVTYRDEVNPAYNAANSLSSKFRQAITFEWGETDIAFLESIKNDTANKMKYSAEKRRAILAIPGLHTNPSKGTAWAEALGMSEANAVSYAELGRRIFEDDKVRTALQDELGITRSVEYTGGMNYQDTLRDLTQTLEGSFFDAPIIMPGAPVSTLPQSDSVAFEDEMDEPFFPDLDSEEVL